MKGVETHCSLLLICLSQHVIHEFHACLCQPDFWISPVVLTYAFSSCRVVLVGQHWAAMMWSFRNFHAALTTFPRALHVSFAHREKVPPRTRSSVPTPNTWHPPPGSFGAEGQRKELFGTWKAPKCVPWSISLPGRGHPHADGACSSSSCKINTAQPTAFPNNMPYLIPAC